jgi:hypothetical protein
MQKTLRKKLSIDRETIRAISDTQLRGVVGGAVSHSTLATSDPCSSESYQAGDPCWAGYGKPCRKIV